MFFSCEAVILYSQDLESYFHSTLTIISVQKWGGGGETTTFPTK